MTIDVFIPIYKPNDDFDLLLNMLYKQTIKPNKVYILHTKTYKGEVYNPPYINDSNIEVISINKEDFDHGGTRGLAKDLSKADIYLFMTQDAVPYDNFLIENLIKPYEDKNIAATYARQISKKQDKLIEKYIKNFNYPSKSITKSIQDFDQLGIKTFFLSNVCSTYKRSVYVKLGGFVEKTIFNEDMIMAYNIINNDYKIGYMANAKVIHSHNYTYMQQFRRNFDLGVSHKEYEEIFKEIKSEKEGISLVVDTCRFLLNRKKYLLIPDLIANSAFKFLGYKLGKNYDKIPKEILVKFSMNKSYWQ